MVTLSFLRAVLGLASTSKSIFQANDSKGYSSQKIFCLVSPQIFLISEDNFTKFEFLQPFLPKI